MTIDDIINTVCRVYNITPDELRTSAKHSIARLRYCATVLCLDNALPRPSLQEVATALGYKSHDSGRTAEARSDPEIQSLTRKIIPHLKEGGLMTKEQIEQAIFSLIQHAVRGGAYEQKAHDLAEEIASVVQPALLGEAATEKAASDRCTEDKHIRGCKCPMSI